MCCLHKQCHISVNIICHPDILELVQFPLGSAQLGTWLLQQTANSICAQSMSKTEPCLRQTHLDQMILVTPGMRTGFPTCSHPASASRLRAGRNSSLFLAYVSFQRQTYPWHKNPNTFKRWSPQCWQLLAVQDGAH